jgi:excisionase family DNA binding protein
MTGLVVALPDEVLEAIISAVTERVLVRLEPALGDLWPAWMSVDTAARYLDVSPERVRKLIARREIPFYQEAPGCRVLFQRAELDGWMTSFQQPSRARHHARRRP